MMLAFFGDIPLFPVNTLAMVYVLLGSLGIGLFLGMISGGLASRRFGK
jgi:hypothetical protein